MPSGKTHRDFNISITAVLTLLSCAIQEINNFYPAAIGMTWGTLFMTPDTDHDGSLPDQNWSVFEKMWNPYSYYFRHRGISHYPILGTLIRVFYLIILLSILIFIGSFVYYKNAQSLQAMITLYKYCLNYKSGLIAMLFGLIVADLLHIGLDELISWYKKRIKTYLKS